MIKETVRDESTVYTDENSGYSELNKRGYDHETVDHSVGEYILKVEHIPKG